MPEMHQVENIEAIWQMPGTDFVVAHNNANSATEATTTIAIKTQLPGTFSLFGPVNKAVKQQNGRIN